MDSTFQNHQLIAFDLNGTVLSSTDVIFDAFDLIGTDLKERFPLIESIFDQLVALSVETGEICIDKVRSIVDRLAGIYDYKFTAKLAGGVKLIVWHIYDKTTFYEKVEAEQQRRQEILIRKEMDSLSTLNN